MKGLSFLNLATIVKRLIKRNIKMGRRKCVIIHGCPSNIKKEMNPETRTYDKHWLPWIKNQLIAKGIKTEIPLMPTPWNPDYGKFKSEFEKYNVDEHTILIGHSCGCAFLVRWLGESKKKFSNLYLLLLGRFLIGQMALIKSFIIIRLIKQSKRE